MGSHQENCKRKLQSPKSLLLSSPEVAGRRGLWLEAEVCRRLGSGQVGAETAGEQGRSCAVRRGHLGDRTENAVKSKEIVLLYGET